MSVAAQQNDDLETIQSQIKTKQAEVAAQVARARQLQNELESVEVNIALTVKAQQKTRAALSANNAQLKQLNTQKESIKLALSQQQESLSKLIRSAYMTGNYDFAKMLLNQQDAANFERTITYYQYLNKESTAKIAQFRQSVAELEEVNKQLAGKQQELEQIQAQQISQHKQLQKQQASRESTLVSIRSAIESDEAKLEILQQNEKNLIEAIAQAQRRAEQQQQIYDGLSQYKGELLMPAKGELRRMFGRIRQGQVKWKGIVINGQVGSAVVAIHQGKVLYADWLRGFGLVTVIDHGDGFMSLYGHNQALLKQAGDAVTAGETIALLGQSGGQSSPNLYFEIRHKGQPINPVGWLKL
ncbi:MAG: peptidoglycan DD-metalloendopeptidase family protein [Paraglaciecola sp.]|nr:peptidoglycan DD-metalloendopeptidase family protein [Paraglaciecola sp.]NCT46796.1 peptidoglycan DD-metalloendopeptidase family protein [Paraglaciecola sp.]